MYVSDLQLGYVYHIHHSTNLINQGECHWYHFGLVFNEVRYSHWASIMWNSALCFTITSGSTYHRCVSNSWVVNKINYVQLKVACDAQTRFEGLDKDTLGA